jgi:hypothetical protein
MRHGADADRGNGGTPMEGNEISIHETRAFLVFLKSNGKWIPSKELAKGANIAERTARAYCLKFTKLGLVDLAEVFPAHKYRLSEKANKRNAAYFSRLEKACEVFGYDVDSPTASGGRLSVVDAFKARYEAGGSDAGSRLAKHKKSIIAELREAGGSDWDKIDDPEAYIREVTGE